MTNDIKYSFNVQGKVLWLSVFQMQQLLTCIINERETDAGKMLELFINVRDETDTERRIREENERINEAINKDIE